MIEFRDFLSRLRNVEKHGDQYLARCPCHDDKKQSLSVSMGTKGIVLKCYAGCETGDIVRALGLKWEDLFEGKQAIYRAKPSKSAVEREQKRPVSDKKKTPADINALQVGGVYTRKVDGELIRETITQVYDYQDHAGVTYMRVCRTEAKSFPTVHLDGGTWYWGDGGHTDGLYRLRDVDRAVRIGEPVYLVEGEKDVDTLHRLGLTATTNKGGAGKWSQKQSEVFRGATVYIVPDNDGPGRKHAKLLLNNLRGVAKEVRIVNLTRQEEVTIPEKGDVSDLVAALGDFKARQVLNDLVMASPVLARVVKDEGYLDFFDAAEGCVVRSSCIYGYTSDKAERLLANFVALPVEQLLIDDGSDAEAPHYEWAIDGWSSTGRKLRRIRLGADEFESMKWPMRYWGIDAIVSDGNGVAAKLRRFIQAAGSAAAVRRTVYTHTGWREIDGQMCFLHGGGAVGAEDVDVRLDFGLDKYRVDGLQSGELYDMGREAALPLCQGATLRAMSLVPLRIGVPLIGFLFLSPLLHFLQKVGRRPAVIPFVQGRSGTGKTSYVTLLMNHFGYDFHFESSQPASFSDSIASVEKKLYIMKDCPLLVDDWKQVADSKRMSERRGLEELIIRMVCDGMKRSRMSAEMTARRDYPARSLCIQTGEELPSETGDSSIARLFVITLEEDDVPLPASKATKERKREMLELWSMARQGAFNENMRSYIAWLATMADKLPGLLVELYDGLYQEAQERLGNRGGHARLPSAAAYLMLGIRMMLEYMRQPDGMFAGADDADIDRMMGTYWDTLAENSQRQAEMMRTQTPTQIFLSTLREALEAGRVLVTDMGTAMQAKPLGMVGYRDQDFYYLIPGETLAAVSKSLDAQKMALPIGKTTLLRQLREEGISISGTGERTLMQVNRGNVHGRFLVIPRSRLEDVPPAEQQLTMVDDPDDPFAKEVRL